jgi:glutathione S-transferase
VIQFYYGSGSPFSWRVQLVLEEKKLDYQPVLLSFQKGEHKSPEHLARSPHGKVPALSDGPLVLYESSAIVEYLEEKYPTPALLPREPAARAVVRIEELECLLYLAQTFQAVARQVFFTAPEKRDAEALATARNEVRAQLQQLDSRVAARKGPFIVGNDFSRADCTWLPFVEIAARAGADLDAATVPRLVAWRDRMRTRPSYDRSYPPHWRG